MNEFRTTVYIASHNYGRYLADAIESVLRQTVTDWELLVIDDGSSDHTPEVIKLYQAHPRIRTFRTEGIGLPAVCNLALSEAKGRYIMRLDGDDVLDENALLVLGNVLDNDPAAAMVFPDYFLIDAHGEIFSHERRGRLYHENHLVDMPPHGACTLIRRAVLDEVGGYRTDLGAQDGLDMWSKIRRLYKCSNVNLPLFYYRRHGTNLTTDSSRIINARRQIKKDATAEQIDQLRPIIAAIPCRRYYDFQTDLWKAEINGQSLLERDIAMCLKSSLFDHVVVACDNPEAEEVLAHFDDPRLQFQLRDERSTMRTASVVSTLENICRVYDPEFRGVTVMRYIQTPLVMVDSLEEALATLAISGADSACAVEEIHSQIFRRTPFGLQSINRPSTITSDLDAIYREVLACVATRNKNFRTGSLTGPSVSSFVVSSPEAFFINSEHELRVARLMAANLSDDAGAAKSNAQTRNRHRRANLLDAIAG